MARGTGIQLNPETWDLAIGGNGLLVGNTLYQDQALLLKTQPGEWKEHPVIGVGLETALNNENTAGWERLIVEQAKRIGLDVEHVKLDIQEGRLIFKARYNDK